MIGRTSLTWRLTLFFAAVSTTVLLALGLVIASAVEQHFEEQDMEVLAGKMELARHALEKVRSPSDLERISQLLDDSLVGHHGLEVVVFGPQHELIFATDHADFPLDLVATSAARDGRRPQVWIRGGTSFRAIAAALPTGIGNAPSALVAVATDIAHHQAFMSSFRKTLWLFVTGAALLTGLLGWAATRRGLAPLRAMREQASVVTTLQLDRRLRADSVPVELAELAETLNEMLARLEDGFRRLSDFSSDIAHELRTPLSNLMTETQVALSRPRSADDYRGILESNAEEFERMARMISDMLFLAKAENGLATPSRERVDVAAEVGDLFDFYDALAEEKRITLTRDGQASVFGDRLMLRRALSNLLSNAIRHTAAGGTIRVVLATDADRTSIVVENPGAAIPPEHLERLFDRFYRADPSRHRGRDGAGLGLGLAITKSIITAHGGSVAARSENGLTRFSMILPAAGPVD